MGLFSSKKRVKTLPHDKPLGLRIPVGYEVRPTEANFEKGQRYEHDFIQRKDVEQYMQNTPAPCPPVPPFTIDAPNGPRPKRFQNYSQVIPRAGHFTEYPTVKDFPYDNQRKGVGYAKIRTPKGKLGEKVVQPGYVRTITDEHKVIQGVLYHPVPTNGKKTSGDFIPAQDVYRSRTFGGLGS